MSDATIQSVTGPVRPEDLGRTLMHEHLIIGWPGWESHASRPGPSDDDIRAISVDQIEVMKSHGVTAMLDPCPNDLGRDAEIMARVAQDTGFTLICATGLYKEDEGGAPYWKFRSQFGGGAEAMAEMFVRELRDEIGATGVRAGIIKVATGRGAITPYEETILRAAAMASVETGAPITTHTDHGTMGVEQQRILTEGGVPAHRIIVGHSCGTDDHDYHMEIVRGGSYLGFDRFGLEMLVPDAVRVESLMKLLRAGAGERAVVSHDSVWCWRGEPIPNPEIAAAMAKVWNPSHFFERIIPLLDAAGASEADIEALLVENPRRFFAGDEPAALA